MLDQGDAQRLAVLCPPHLAEQLADRDARQVPPRRRARSHRDSARLSVASASANRCSKGTRLRSSRPTTSSPTAPGRLRTRVSQACHHRRGPTCADASARRGGRHQRYQLVTKAAADESRNMILVTATPHSGKEDAFLGLVGFLDPSFKNFPDDLSTDQRAQSGAGSRASSCSAPATSSTTSATRRSPRARCAKRLRLVTRIQGVFSRRCSPTRGKRSSTPRTEPCTGNASAGGLPSACSARLPPAPPLQPRRSQSSQGTRNHD